ncbi:unnamed protein product [Owenia fusiformis]|uniref:Uncharacterized protein n=1 Tax=Owenia fusiformis TaxID=6347 RepID=A0A8S4PE84_OWEFU|nr:unnamed protein product [Owenia fusiformis]
MSSRVKKDKKQTSSIDFLPLHNKGTLEAVRILRDIARESYGPFGKLNMVQNTIGGHVTVTSSSNRLFQAISVSDVIVKLITTSLQGHVATHGDAGLWGTIMAINLIEKSPIENTHPHLLVDIYEMLLQYSMDFLKSPECPAVLDIDISDMNTMRDVIRCVVNSKPACGLLEYEQDNICSIILEAFLKSIPSSCDNSLKFFSVNFVSMEGLGANNMKLYDGVLLEAPSIPTYLKNPLSYLNLPVSEIPVAIVTTSMGGDSEDFLDIKYESGEQTDGHALVLDTILKGLANMVQSSVRVLICQKVAHPRVKAYCTEQGVMLLDRLGISHMESLCQLTGARKISSFSSYIDEGLYGSIDSANHLVMAGKSYVHLTRTQSGVTTVLLAGRREEALNELKVVCDTALRSLRQLLWQPKMLYGGGCWETILSAHINYLISSKMSELTEQLGCSRHQLRQAAEAFTHSLHDIAMATSDTKLNHKLDMKYGHHWIAENGNDDYASCMCGAITRDNALVFKMLGNLGIMDINSDTAPEKAIDIEDGRRMLLDNLPAHLGALLMAVNTASAILKIHCIVKDRN